MLRLPHFPFTDITGPTWLENPFVVRTVAPLLAHGNGTAAPGRIGNPETSRIAIFIERNLLDIGLISSASLFLAVWSVGLAPLTVFAGTSLAAVGCLRAYQGLIMHDSQTPEALNKRGSLTRFFNRPAATYTLSSLTGLGSSLVAIGLAATGHIQALGMSGSSAIRFGALALFSLVFSASNNMKAARLDRDRGYEVQALPGLRRLNPSWSEKLSVIGNIARNFIAGPVAGLLALPLMREALKFSSRDKNYEEKGGVSYTEKTIAPLYGWTTPHSDSGMARRMTGLANVFSAAGALVSGNAKAAASLAYPAVAQFLLGKQSDQAYAARRLTNAFHGTSENRQTAGEKPVLDLPQSPRPSAWCGATYC